MWIPKKQDWHDSWSDNKFSSIKYFFERIKQKVDYQESISNIHSTTCGFSLIDELIDVGEYVLKKEKAINRFRSLMNEARNKALPFSIYNDPIINDNYKEIIEFICLDKNNEPNNIKLENVPKILHRLRIFQKTLHKEYYIKIIEYTKNVNFMAGFDRNIDNINKLINCLIPYLIHTGYSPISISDVAYRYIKKPANPSHVINFLNLFSKKNYKYCFAIKLLKNEERNNIELFLKEFFNINELNFEYEIKNFAELKELFPSNIQQQNNDAEFIYIVGKYFDPHSFLRKLYDFMFKYSLIADYEIKLNFISDYFDNIYSNGDVFQKSSFYIDPINIKQRKSTLHSTLSSLRVNGLNCTNGKVKNMPYIENIYDSLSYYNLSLKSRSIENSFLLLWTSLETLLPFYGKNSDIESVQEFVSQTLSLGAVGRELASFVNRLKQTESQHDYKFRFFTKEINNIHIATKEEISSIYEILTKDYSNDSLDPYCELKEYSELLTSEFIRLNNIYKNTEERIKYWNNKINTSETAIRLQLDRIYLHRNQIVHSGKLINEYSNLWRHLEWYVGKLISIYIIHYLIIKNRNISQYDIYIDILSNKFIIDNYLQGRLNGTTTEESSRDFFLNNLLLEWQF